MTSTTANAMPSTNGAAANSVNSQMTQNTGGARQSLRSNPSLKASDGGRRQSGSPVDGGHRRNNPQKAWGQNTNPINQKSSYSHQNGGASHRKSTISPKPSTSKESNTPDMHANDRLVFLLTACIGLTATITTKNGDKFTGVFSGSALESNESSIMLKMTQHVLSPQTGRSNGLSDFNSPYIGPLPDHQMIFDVQDIADVAVAEVTATGMAAKERNGTPIGFKTDTDISGGRLARERELQRWEPSTEPGLEVSLESSGAATWDQFEVNERLFGATTSYDENLYTTRIDRNDPSYKRKEVEAARIAREIELSETDNPHLREERGLAHENDYAGEEEKYSGVRRDEKQFPPLQSGQPNKYTPPARRAPTGHPTVPGALVDSAIISAKAAKPESLQKQSVPKTNIIPPSKTPEAPQEAATEAAKVVARTKPAADAEAKITSAKAPIPTTTPPKRAGGETASANVETEVLDHFRQFANNEKMKLQERRRNQASHDRTIKINELMKFSQNFKLGTPVPKDLVPILAKDPSKQTEIVERAKRQHEEKMANLAVKKVGSTVAPTSTTEQKQPPRAAPPPSTAPAAPSERQQFPRGRQGYPPMGPHSAQPVRPMHHQGPPPRSGPGYLGQRLADMQQQRKSAMGPVPTPLSIQDRMPPTGPMADQSTVSSPHKQVQTPTSAVSTKFNVRALEFKPNPAASTFTPGVSAASSSPASNPRTRSISRTASPSVFFGNRKLPSASERPSIKDHFNPVKRMKKEATEQSSKDYAFNGGIPQAYRTQPTWEVPPANEEKTYLDMFKLPIAAPSVLPQSRSASNPPMQHQHQLPFHQHNNHAMPPTSGPPHMHHLHPHQHHPPGPPHYEDHHRMQMSASSSQAYPSPRLQQSHIAYQSPMAHHAQLAFGQPGPQFYVPGQGPQPHMRQYPGGPQFVAPQNGVSAPMMVQQPSSGPYMGMPQGVAAPYNPQMHMYSPSPAHAYPQHGQPPPQTHSGYPSPGRGAPMMMHQGSQQGQAPQPVMYMNPAQHGQPVYPSQQSGHMPPVRPGYGQHQQPHFSSSPRQAHHYPHHQHRPQSNNYNQMPHMPPPHMQGQAPPQNAGPGAHPVDVGDEVK
ncbi:hypothetical protein AJ80_06749 [Polytolypa hystricis UAMH7299]|uniref:LsmAD domain-containing protein n=1 Tax=Polytolypa hystricis (strain UAMH7299) TaxID=1447883 RepID=A0A2B7XTP8_POLH7|nr:hypothetical protein AJ80_06749 [Polytolypa hystricis UAMH7299]